MSSEKFLIDTTIWVKYLRGLDSTVKERISALVLEDRAYTSEIIVMEILRGARSDKEFGILYEDFLALPQLLINRNVWESAWQTAYKLKKNGINIPMADIIILTTATHYKCTLIHADKHFSQAAKYAGLKVMEL